MSRANDAYERAISQRDKMKKLHDSYEEEKREYFERIDIYRHESVNRVLDFIRDEYRAGRVCNLELLLCHCQNKLNGNIDGTELSLDKSYRGVEFEKKG